MQVERRGGNLAVPEQQLHDSDIIFEEPGRIGVVNAGDMRTILAASADMG
jgi:hypothetical protein